MPRGFLRTLHGHILCTTLASIAAVTSTAAQDSDTLDCSNAVTVDGVTYNLAPLAGEHTLRRTRETPPSTMEDELQFNLCQDIPRREDIAEADQCPTGTRACLITTNKKSGTDNRVVAAIPVAQTATLKPSYSALQSSAGLSVVLHGPPYPPNTLPNTTQSFNLTLLCTQDAASDPKFVSYESGMVSVEWSTSAGCPTKRTEGGNDGDGTGDTGDREQEGEGEHTTGGSGIGWFFLLLFISIAGYFILGAYYNYNNFGATGWDLVPHRDFWRDVPYLLRDFTEHLCSTLRPGRHAGSRRGYMAV